jgi:hypothetical protein
MPEAKQTFGQAIAQNAWDWDLNEFARRLGLDAETHYTRQKFQRFQELARVIAEFDTEALAILASPKECHEPDPT